MPELPEVETIRRELEREAVGKKVKSVEVHGTRTVRRQTKKAFIAKLDGVKVTGVDRKGKYLLVRLDSGDVLIIHLRMSGQLLRAAAKDPVPKHTHVIITFTVGGQLRFVDPRTFGEMFVASPETLDTEVPELAELGFDPVEQPVSWQTFGQLLRNHRMKLKAFLTDQTIIAGLGNIYADEILFAAGLRYDRMTDSLSTQEIRRLYRSVVETLHDAIKYGGSTLADEQYVDLNGKPGEYQEHHKVYDREKLPCFRCRRATISKSKFAGRSTYYCELCQV
ncbi:MAG TPA: bifunctional DNA-formamidopyrimidine glycosylase/DNA-(apurinic or apyrimidinic site) lyase [Acidimicrobiales bacterium]